MNGAGLDGAGGGDGECGFNREGERGGCSVLRRICDSDDYAESARCVWEYRRLRHPRRDSGPGGSAEPLAAAQVHLYPVPEPPTAAGVALNRLCALMAAGERRWRGDGYAGSDGDGEGGAGGVLDRVGYRDAEGRRARGGGFTAEDACSLSRGGLPEAKTAGDGLGISRARSMVAASV